jgi:6-pyruvoyl-tetrahydropterin synthase
LVLWSFALFTVSVETHFWASHRLTLPDGSKEPLHHHDNIVADFGNSPLEKLDYFQRNNPSAENVAKYIYEKLEPELPKDLKLSHIRVVEQPGCSVKFGE